MNFLQMKKYYLLIKEERYKKLTLLILVWANLSEKKTKKKQSKTKEKINRCYYESKNKNSGYNQ